MGICCLSITYIKYGKFYVHNNTFYSVISKIKGNLPLIKCDGKNIISEDFIDIILK